MKLKLFQSCCSKDDSSSPYDSLLCRSSKPGCSFIGRHVASALGCGSSRACSSSSVNSEAGEEEACEYAGKYFQWLKEEDWLIIARLRQHEEDEAAPRRKVHLDSAPSYLIPQTFDDKKQDSSKEEDLTEIVKISDYECENELSSLTPPRLSRLQWMIPCAVEGKVRESFAVVKKSRDPYEDFKESMMEMVVERGMFEKDDLEKLLHCFLSLNSKDHHAVIVKAFTEVWHAVFEASSYVAVDGLVNKL